jgi:hypothetical protein
MHFVSEIDLAVALQNINAKTCSKVGGRVVTAKLCFS